MAILHHFGNLTQVRLRVQLLEDSTSGLCRTPGTRVGSNPSGVQIPYPPPPSSLGTATYTVPISVEGTFLLPPASRTLNCMNSTNFAWAATLFGTAVGAGILFLPLQAGAFGFWPLLIATVVIGPITYLSHMAYVRIIAHSPAAHSDDAKQSQNGKPTEGAAPAPDLLAALSSYFGRRAGYLLAIAYLVMLVPVLLVYAVSLTNAVDSFLSNQLQLTGVPRPLVAIACLVILTAALALGEKIMLLAAQITVIPLLIALGGFSLYLIPRWDMSSFLAVRSETSFAESLFLILPVLVFSFTFIGSTSQFAVSSQRSYGPHSDIVQRKVIALTTALLTIFTMLFVWSCSLSLGASGLADAAAANLPVLSYFANITNTPWLALLTPIITICAIASSYIGVALGAREGLQFVLKPLLPLSGPGAYGILCVIGVIVAIAEPGIMDLITVAGGVLITLFQFVLPMITMYCVGRLAPLRRAWGNVIVIGFGALVLISTILGLFS